MEVVGAAVGALVATTSDLLCSCVSSKTNTTFNLHSNLAAVEKEMNSLKDRFKEVKRETEAAEKEGNEIRAQVVTWLQDVETLQPGVDANQGQMVNNKKPSRCFLNCRKRYRASREVEKTLEEIKRLLLVADKFNHDVVCPTRVPGEVEHILGPSIQGQTTASKKLDEIRKALDDGFKRIGIWGLGGVGKTTLVKNLNNELKNASTQPFGIVIWATVSKNVVIKNVQTLIAERLNLEVKMEESVQRMASRLYQRLEKEEKFLLILDDVWAKIDLDTLGVPGPEVHKGCKIILTSRLKEVCRAMTTDLEIKIEVLNDVEAWQLFCQKAGDVAHLEEIKPLAEAVVKECCRLPLAIITVGAAMRKKTKVELWKHALNQLQRSVPSIEGIEAEVYKPLRLSYDSLQGLVEMLEDFIESDASFAGLKSLSIRNCPTSLGRGGGCAARCDLLPNLEELHLYSMENLNSISELAGHLGLRFHSLRSIKVGHCRQMKYLLSCGDFIQTLPNLEVIKVSDCANLEKLFNNESGQNISPDPMVPKLRILQLGFLPEFKTLCRHKETWPCLEQVDVWRCKGVRSLPLTNQNAGTIKEIKGESEWWDALEWDDDQTKTSLLPFFHPQ